MFLGWGIEPSVSVLVGLLFICVLSDFIFSSLSARFSLATSEWQEKHFLSKTDRGPRFFFSLFLFQIINWDKKSFFRQLPSLGQVFSLNSKQFSSSLVTSLFGFSLSFLLLLPLPPLMLLACALAGIFLLFKPDKVFQDLGVSALLFALFSLLMLFLDWGLKEVGLSIVFLEFSELIAVLILLVSILLFKTIVPFVITLTSLQLLFGLSHHWWPLFLFSQLFLVAAMGFWNHRRDRAQYMRLHFTVLAIGLLATLLFAVLFNLGWSFLSQFHSPQSWLESLRYTLFLCAFYYSGFLVLLLFLYPKHSKALREEVSAPPGFEEGDSYSYIASLVRLRQEMQLFERGLLAALESLRVDLQEPQTYFQSGPQRTTLRLESDELKELCFQLGRKPSYPEQVQEVMNTYRGLNQYESLWGDLLFITQHYLLKDLNKVDSILTDWMNLQLDIFIQRLNQNSPPGNSSSEELLEKSYQLIEQIQISGSDSGAKSVFYRVTDGLGRKLESF